MTVYKVGAFQFGGFREARAAARVLNAADRQEPVEIFRDGDLYEIWIGEVTLHPTGLAFLAYSSADLDGIGAVERAGDKFTATSRGTPLGEFSTLFEAADALHKFAKSPAYRSG